MFETIKSWFTRRNRKRSSAERLGVSEVKMAYSDPLKEYELNQMRSHAAGLSASAAMDNDERRHIREFAREEVWTRSSFLAGMTDKFVDAIIGKVGPMLQLDNVPAGIDADEIVQNFQHWAETVDWVTSLKTQMNAYVVDGEGFVVMYQNPQLEFDGMIVPLGLQNVEADQMERRDLTFRDNDGSGGILSDEHGNPIAYPMLNQHPGDLNTWISQNDYEYVAAPYVAHLFKKDRPGQKRGISQYLQALPLAALMRRYTLAAVNQAEKHANFTGVLEAEMEYGVDDEPCDPYATADGESYDQWWKTKNMSPGGLMMLPPGLKLNAFSSQFSDDFEAFRRSLQMEAANCISMPYTIAANDVSQANFASAKFGGIPWTSKIAAVRHQVEKMVLKKIVDMWMRVYLRRQYRMRYEESGIRVSWYWDNQDPVNREAEALADMREIMMGARPVDDPASSRGYTFDKNLTITADKLFGGDKAKTMQWFADNIAKHSAMVTMPPQAQQQDNQQSGDNNNQEN